VDVPLIVVADEVEVALDSVLKPPQLMVPNTSPISHATNVGRRGISPPAAQPPAAVPALPSLVPVRAISLGSLRRPAPQPIPVLDMDFNGS